MPLVKSAACESPYVVRSPNEIKRLKEVPI